MLKEKLKNKKVVLVSQSPRRRELLKGLDIDFEVQPSDVDESYPANLQGKDIAVYLSGLKAAAFELTGKYENALIIAADTIVLLSGEVLSKPADYDNAFKMLKQLSGKAHEVITGVTLRSKTKSHTFYSATKVWFRELTDKEIDYYIYNFKPYDKAGAYGIQEWIGYTAIERIEGSYFNVVGLPVQKVYVEMMKF